MDSLNKKLSIIFKNDYERTSSYRNKFYNQKTTETEILDFNNFLLKQYYRLEIQRFEKDQIEKYLKEQGLLK